MNEAPLEQEIAALLASFPAVRGCALVDADSGLVWPRHPDPGMDELWEASVDHWRLQQRLGRHFEGLGQTSSIATYHSGGILAILPCLRDPDLLMVCVADYRKMDWARWESAVRALGQRLRAGL